MSASEAREDRGATPFTVFGIALVVGAAWAVYMGVAFSNTANFVADALPTVAGVTIAVAAILLIALWAPKNE
jgi:uncharacterized membrane protein YozB (DUF420 family)